MKNKSEQTKPEQNIEKKYTFENEGKREIAVCVAVQKIGLATIPEIIEWITSKGGKITEKQVSKCAENLRRRDMLSIDLSQKDDKGISAKRYVMKKIKVAIPEVAQIKDLVDDESLKPLIEELDRSKGTHKKGMKTFDYYVADVEFKTIGDVQGFIPDEDGICRHYRRNNMPVFYSYHFKNWFRANLPLVNRSSSAIGDIKFCDGTANPNGEMVIIEKFITNVESGFHSSSGTGGRGSRKIECLPEGTTIKTSFAIPRELISPEKFESVLNIFSKYGSAFGGGAKLSTGKLEINKFEIATNELFKED